MSQQQSLCMVNKTMTGFNGDYARDL